MKVALDRLIPPVALPERGKPFKADFLNGDFLYCHGQEVYIVKSVLDDEAESKAELVGRQSSLVTVARFSPDGQFVASANDRGSIHIWQLGNKEERLVKEFEQVMRVEDLAWSLDGRHIAIGGSSGNVFIKVFSRETGSSVGELSGPTRPVTRVQFVKWNGKEVLAVSSDDNNVYVYGGPSLKLLDTLKGHTSFALGVVSSPEEGLATYGADGKVLLRDKEEAVSEGSSIIHAEYLEDNSLWTVTLWGRVSTRKAGLTKSWDLFAERTQVLWARPQQGAVIAMTLDGSLHFGNSESKRLLIRGHSRGVTALFVNEDLISSASYDGRIVHWKGTKACEEIGLSINTILSDSAYTIGNRVVFKDRLVDLKSHILAARIINGSLVAVTSNTVFKKNEEELLPYKTVAACLTKDGTSYLVNDKGNLYSNVLLGKMEHISVLACSPDGRWLAGTQDRKIVLFDLREKKLVNTKWCFHAASITCLAWSDKYLASGSIDSALMIWSPEELSKPIAIQRHAHVGPVNVLAFQNSNLISGGQDGAIRCWKLDP